MIPSKGANRCSNGSPSWPSSPRRSPSSAVQAAAAAPVAKTFVFCSDISYPPEEFVQGGKNLGSDIDIGTAVAKRLGMSVKFQNTGFDGIVAALLSNNATRSSAA